METLRGIQVNVCGFEWLKMSTLIDLLKGVSIPHLKHFDENSIVW